LLSASHSAIFSQCIPHISRPIYMRVEIFLHLEQQHLLFMFFT
jgi:hypothetical protein